MKAANHFPQQLKVQPQYQLGTAGSKVAIVRLNAIAQNFANFLSRVLSFFVPPGECNTSRSLSSTF